MTFRWKMIGAQQAGNPGENLGHVADQFVIQRQRRQVAVIGSVPNQQIGHIRARRQRTAWILLTQRRQPSLHRRPAEQFVQPLFAGYPQAANIAAAAIHRPFQGKADFHVIVHQHFVTDFCPIMIPAQRIKKNY